MNQNARRTMVLAACFGGVAACSGSPKPCPISLETQYTAELVEECAGATSVESCPSYPAIKAKHEAAQEDAGCRVK